MAIGLAGASVLLLPSHGRAPHSPLTTTPSTTQPRKVVVGLRTVTWTDNNPAAGLAVNPAPNGTARPRILVTSVYYPAFGSAASGVSANAPFDTVGAPYPIVVFAHGFDTLPATYASLLETWVRAGYVVVAPAFPDENANEIASLGAPTLAESQIAESDVVNEPYDLAYVIGRVVAAAGGQAASGASWLKGVADPSKIALAGHSDGAQAVAALVYGTAYASTYDTLATKPFAVEILSGSELSGTYAPPSPAPPMLTVESATDLCNLPQDASALFAAAGGGWYLSLSDASHFGPYVATGSAGLAVDEVTTSFFKAALSDASTSTTAATGSSPATLPGVGNLGTVATLYPPSVPPKVVALSPPTQSAHDAACALPSAPAG